jgi:RNA polymerase sigma-54 factor
MALQLKQSQKLSQSLSMTPQLQHAIKLLQLGRLDYISAIAEELEKNPMLEEVREGGAGDNFGDGDFSSSGDGGSESLVAEGLSNPAELESESRVETVGDRSPFSEEEYWEYLGDSQAGTSSLAQGANDYLTAEIAAPKSETLTSFLIEQLDTLEFSSALRHHVLSIIGNLNAQGYLECDLSELGGSEGGISEWEAALSIVQSLDPAGVGARSLSECLLLQLQRADRGDSLAAKIVVNHLPLLQARRYQDIARIEGVAIEKVYQSLKEIQRLEPHPTRVFQEDAAEYVIPDIYVVREGDQYIVTLNDDGVPRLRISKYYLDLLRGSEGKASEGREFINERLKAATWLLKSIQQRQQSIFKVTESIVRHQQEFFDKGIQYLKPLVLKAVADDIGLHESTVSRVTSNKFVHTPLGVFELKFFFSSSISGVEGELSSSAIREKIKQMISAEDESKPLSDQQIVDALSNQGVDIARRTVAKYREGLGFLSASKRKKLF